MNRENQNGERERERGNKQTRCSAVCSLRTQAERPRGLGEQVTEVLNVAEERLGLQLDYASVASLSASDLLLHARLPSAPAPLQVYPDVNGPDPALGLGSVLMRQTAALLLCLACVLLASLPAVALVEVAFDPASPWWLLRGRGGPLVVGAVVVWMAAYSLLCVLLSHACLPRHRPRFVALWSWEFARWMAVQRALAVWEYAVGRCETRPACSACSSFPLKSRDAIRR
eukprot:2821404-Rhodomonas_salina.2